MCTGILEKIYRLKNNTYKTKIAYTSITFLKTKNLKLYNIY